MPATTKGRRKIIVNGRLFLWYVTEGENGWLMVKVEEGMYRLLPCFIHMFSEDKKFNVKYLAGQATLPAPYLPHVIVNGQEFPGIAPGLARPLRVLVPRWPDDESFSRDFIRRFIEWCFKDETKTVLVEEP